ncbi:MAG: hypothetical protein GY913_18805 [Proteobacteria bacterium]|nr:hypothetical protein [Pseudomonadota bacterium]MCP4918961.1 hypothetical protein [Pseudomonadota bacterium]
MDRGVSCLVTEGDGISTPYDDRFVGPALRRVDAPRKHYAFSDWNPADLPGKGGFGGSAAAVVAACAAGGARGFELLDAAVAVHHEVQGSGSGMDVRASASGGLRRYQGDRIGDALDAPHLLAVWSGASAETGPRVLRYRAWEGREAFARASQELVDAGPSIETLTAAYELLRSMASQAGLAYDTPGHQRIAALAQDHGGAAKPSGAGGGDVAIALFDDPDAMERFAQSCALDGLTPIPIHVVPSLSVLDV